MYVKIYRDGERERYMLPPFSTSELPSHEVGELGGGDVRIRVSVLEKRRELVSIIVI